MRENYSHLFVSGSKYARLFIPMAETPGIAEYLDQQFKMKIITFVKHSRIAFEKSAIHEDICIHFKALPVAEIFCAQTGRQEVLGSNPGRACRPNHLGFSVVFFETPVNTG